MALLGRQSPEKGISAKADRQNRFTIKRHRTPVGLFEYTLENAGKHEKIMIPRHLYDRFRSSLCHIKDQLDVERLQSQEIDHKVYFKELECYRIRCSLQSEMVVSIQNLMESGAVSVSKDALPTLINLLYHDDLDHPSDTFDGIVDYHRLFQFTFNEGSSSITSGLVLRKSVLCETDNYTPSLSRESRAHKVFYPGEEAKDAGLKGIAPTTDGASDTNKGLFKSKLGHRDSDKDYSVDYESLFQSQSQAVESLVDKASPARNNYKKSLNTFPLPILASDVKRAKSKTYKVELSQDDAKEFRERFLTDRSCELYLGFEIIDSIHKVNGRMKSFRFPLYYTKISVEESGRVLHVTPPKQGDVYMNHIALINLVEQFSKVKGDEPLKRFLSHLLAQKIEVGNKLHPMRIHRKLPFADDVFDQSRDILIGKPGDGGKGGILESLKLIGMECDLEAVILYKVEKVSSPCAVALDKDLYSLQELAHEKPSQFYSSVLGRFLVPERKEERKKTTFSTMPLNPGYRSRSMKKLMENIDQHDLLLLEGPPGTGKTFTIMNLFIHCLNEGKRLLIVSDQKAAIHALTEKLEEYLVGKDFVTPEAKKTLALWKSAVRVVDDIPGEEDKLGTWVSKLIRMLNMDYCKEQDWPQVADTVDADIKALDKQFAQVQQSIEHILSKRLGSQEQRREVAAKFNHPTTETDIRDLVEFLQFMGAGEHQKINRSSDHVENQDLIKRFVENRKFIAQGELAATYSQFALVITNPEKSLEFARKYKAILAKLIESKPRTAQDFKKVFDAEERSEFSRFLLNTWTEDLDPDKNGFFKGIANKIQHPSLGRWKFLYRCFVDQETLLHKVKDLDKSESILRQFQDMHMALNPDREDDDNSLALELVQLSQDEKEVSSSSVQVLLQKLSELQTKRDQLVKDKYLASLSAITKNVIASQKNGTNLATSISNLLESLKDSSSIEHGSGVPILKELQGKLMEAFPIWICRKQTASFLFPTQRESFDLVVVDEAGQCRVDDAIPLLYRAKKLMVVGDEKQTVLDKNSPVDDYLFAEFELEEQLRTSQARGVKGGGSNLFSLVKSIKQGGVMLDEHYRCPPDIITYSNQYVYNSDLRIMQWTHPTARPAVEVDYSEKKCSPSRKPTNGKYKSIETDMIDRYFDYVAKSIQEIEKETGKRINVETDVALCYFLLKNEPYIKDKKSEFLQKLGRGNDVLDGAGAALQGKERDYIFYLWDVNRSNMTFFRQGDDPDKRKGELNVLMSRPKIRAYHYLHHTFESLKHDSCSITDYLWKTYKAQQEEQAKEKQESRTRRPGKNFRPWQRSSGQAIGAILSFLFKSRDVPSFRGRSGSHHSVVVGDPKRKIDFMILAKPGQKGKSIGVVDLSAFEDSKNLGEDVVDYYFQLKRVSPPIEPNFSFMHEIADERSESYQDLEAKVKILHGKPAA